MQSLREAETTQSLVDDVISGRQAVLFDTEHELILASYRVLKACVASDNQLMEVAIGRQYNSETRHDDALEGFRDAFLDVDRCVQIPRFLPKPLGFFDFARVASEHCETPNGVLQFERRGPQISAIEIKSFA